MHANADAEIVPIYRPDMRKALILVAVAVGIAGCPPPEHPSVFSGCPLMANGRSQWRGDDGVCRDQPDPPRAEPPPILGHVPSVSRADTLQAQAAIPGITITVEPAGLISWKLTIRNDTDGPASMLFDESSFVDSHGNALGRLIRGETRKIDSARAQPPIPIPPHAQIVDLAIPEKAADAELYDWGMVGKQVLPSVQKTIDNSRDSWHRALIGGRLVIALDVSGSRQLWTGVVEEPEAK